MKQEVVKTNTRKIVIAGIGYFPGGNSEETISLPENIDDVTGNFTPEQIVSYVCRGLTDEASSGGRDDKLMELIGSAKKMTNAMAAGIPNASREFIADTFLGLPVPDGGTMGDVLKKNGFVKDSTAGDDDKRVNRHNDDTDDNAEEEEEVIE